MLCGFVRTNTKRKMRGFPGTVAVTARRQHRADPEKRNDKGRGEENLQEIDELCFKPFAVQ